MCENGDSSTATPYIAVIVPVYGAENTLRRCIGSCLAQTWRDLELILVDDGSKDGSGAICDEAAAADPRVKVIHKENEGLMATWMRGVRESSAPYLSFVDSDDWIEPCMLERMAFALSGRRRDKDAGHDAGLAADYDAGPYPDGPLKEIICCSYTIDREETPRTSRREYRTHGAPPGIYEGGKLQSQIKDHLLGNETRRVIASRCMKLFSRELIEDNLRFCDPSIRMGEDLNITTPAILDAERVVLLEGAYDYHYVFYQNSMVHAYDPDLYDNIVRLRGKLLEILTAKGVADAPEMTEREYLFLFCLEMKNELRRADVPAGVSTGRIRALCGKEHSGELVRHYPGKIQDPANRMIAWMLRRPTALRVRMVRRIFLFQR